MYGAGGYARYQITDTFQLTRLQELRDGAWHDWMVDTPWEWHGLGDLAARCRGVTLTSGLGLGLVLQHLAENPAVDRAIVCERNREVLDLVGPHLSVSTPVELVHADLFEAIPRFAREGRRIDSFVVDIAAGDPRDPFVREVLDRAYVQLRALYPQSVRLFFGAQRYYDLIDAVRARRDDEQRAGLGWCERCRRLVTGRRLRPDDERWDVFRCPEHGDVLIMERMLPDRTG
jgi:hypothetical protein